MAVEWHNLVGESGTLTGTVVTLTGTAADDCETFTTAGVTDGSTVYVLVKESTTKLAVWEATYASGAGTITRVTELEAVGTLTGGGGAVDVRIVNPAEHVAYGLTLESKTITSSDETGKVGVMTYATVSGLSAGIDYILPATAAVGDRCGIMLATAAAATYGNELLIRANTGDTLTLRGTDYTATEATRLFIKGECMVFRCVVANSTWVVEIDNRIPASSSLTAAAVQTLGGSSWVDIDFNTGEDDWDRGDIFDDTLNSNNGGFRIRRAGQYFINTFGAASVEDQEFLGLSLKVDGVQVAALERFNYYNSFSTSSTVRTGPSWLRQWTSTGNVGLMGQLTSTSTDIQCIFQIEEQL